MKNLKNLVVCLICCLLPAAAMGLGVLLLFANTVFNLAFAVTYVIIPLTSVLLIGWIAFVGKKALVKALLIVAVLVVFAVSFLYSSIIGTFEMLEHSENGEIGEDYSETCDAFPSMPTVAELTDYVGIEHYDYFSSCFGFFTCDADTLIVTYEPLEYQKQKALLDDRYVFQEDKITVTDEKTLMPIPRDPYFTVGDYSFRLLAIGSEYGSETYYPKRMIFIATNDRESSISYTAFCDDDLDYIESPEEFLLNDCGWKYIIRSK